MLNLGYKKAHKFVADQQSLGNNVKWRGWDMVFFRANPSAQYSVDTNGRPNGVWNRDESAYGYETVVSPNERGLWSVDNRSIRRPNNRTRP
jgi:hypothetical protein